MTLCALQHQSWTKAKLSYSSLEYHTVRPMKQAEKIAQPISKESLYRVSQKKRNGGFLVHCELKVLHIFISLDRASLAEENDT